MNEILLIVTIIAVALCHVRVYCIKCTFYNAVHICDWNAEGRLCLPGEGCFDFGAFFARLKEAGYDGPVIIEPYLALIGSDEALMQSITYIKEIIKGVNRNE